MAAWSGRAGLWLACVAALAAGGCDDTATAPVTTTSAAPPAAAPVAAAGRIVLNPQQGGTGETLVNDPSAPADAPVCGKAAREADGIGQSLLGRQYAGAGACSSFACYDPATATYLGADGYRHVCR